MQDPFDRTRPLWLFVIVDGLEDGRGAMFAKLHHTIADGYATPPGRALPHPGRAAGPAGRRPRSRAARVGRRGPSRARERRRARRRRRLCLLDRAISGAANWERCRAAGEVVLWEQTLGVRRTWRQAVATIADVRSQVGQSGDVPEGHPSWRAQPTPPLRRDPGTLPAMRASAKALGGTINDGFVTGAVLGAVHYHERRETPLEALNISFVVSTRDTGGADTTFAPTRVRVPAGAMTVQERFAAIRAILAAGRQVRVAAVPWPASPGWPTCSRRHWSRAWPGHRPPMDFATSNVRGAPAPTYVSGAKILWTGTLGPVAGTAFNLTAMSYDGSFDIGFHVDPMAVADCDDLRRCIATGFQEPLAAAGQTLATDHEVA